MVSLLFYYFEDNYFVGQAEVSKAAVSVNHRCA